MKNLPRWFKVALVFAAVYLFAFQPIPYYMESPGRAFGLDEMVEVDDTFSEESGEFYITTVGVQQVTPMTALSSLRPFHDLLSEEELFGDIQDFEEYDVIQQYYMDSSANTAIQVAFDAANYPYELTFNGVYVLQVLEESDFYGDLKVGDTVQKVNGQAFENSHEFIEYVGQLDIGESITLTFERDGQIHETSGELIRLESGIPGIGIGLVDHTVLISDPPVEIHSGGIGGPSAGLMFSLQIYNQLVEENIHGDYKIAGTGTIEPDGTVGRIGGVEKKVVAADAEDADFFLAPDDEIPKEAYAYDPSIQTNYEAAVEAAEAIETDMEIIPVKTFQDALDFLSEIQGTQANASEESAWQENDKTFNKPSLVAQ